VNDKAILETCREKASVKKDQVKKGRKNKRKE